MIEKAEKSNNQPSANPPNAPQGFRLALLLLDSVASLLFFLSYKKDISAFYGLKIMDF